MPERTALASVEWDGRRALVCDVISPADDDIIVDAIGHADKTGIDCPFGWPDAFVRFVSAHHRGHADVSPCGIGAGWKQALTWRRTDAFVRSRLRIVPLSVSADKIAHVALRCAVLLARLDAAGAPVDRSGTGPVVEVYPAASLRSWDLGYKGYKRPDDLEVLGHLVDDLLTLAPWLELGSHQETIRWSHDVFDAVIAAMTARAAARGQTCPPGAGDLSAAQAEGWIAVPTMPIGKLL
jgi:predicted nuclease with RNAse H fold